MVPIDWANRNDLLSCITFSSFIFVYFSCYHVNHGFTGRPNHFLSLSLINNSGITSAQNIYRRQNNKGRTKMHSSRMRTDRRGGAGFMYNEVQGVTAGGGTLYSEVQVEQVSTCWGGQGPVQKWLGSGACLRGNQGPVWWDPPWTEMTDTHSSDFVGEQYM